MCGLKGVCRKRHCILISVVGVFLLSVGSWAELFRESDVPEFHVLVSEGAGTEISIVVPEPLIEDVVEGGRTYRKIRIAEAGWSNEAGCPELPVLARLVAVPRGIPADVEVREREYSVRSDIRLWPCQEERVDKRIGSSFIMNEEVYGRDSFYPDSVVEVGSPFRIRDLCVIPLIIHPVQYNPVRGELKIVRSLRVKVHVQGGHVSNTAIPEAFEKFYRSSVLNYHAPSSSQELVRGGYLIVTPDIYYEALQPLVEWKRQKGHHTEVVRLSQIGANPDNDEIRNYIMNYYAQSAVPLEYVVLVGDVAELPTFFYYDEMEENYSPLGPWDAADHPYSMLDGDDYFPDVFVGRLSVSSVNEMHTVVNKIVSYERDPYVGQTEWYKSALLVCNYGGIASARTINLWIGEKMLDNGFTQVDTSFTFNMLDCDVGFISSVINSGVSYINYRGELDWGGWTSPDNYNNIDALNNGFMLPVITDFVCRSAAFYFNCPAEAWLRAGSVLSPRGAVAVMGPTAINTKGYFNNALDGGFYAGVFDDSLSTPGQALARAKMELYMQYPLNRGPGHAHNSVECYFYMYTLMGDPGLEMWTDSPQSFHVEHPSKIAVGSNQISLTVEDGGQQPIRGAYVCLTGEGHILSGGFTGSDGKVRLPLPVGADDIVTATVTKHNFKPYQALIPAEQAPVCVALSDRLIDDDSSDQSLGDGDGTVNPGEIIELALSLRNVGTSQTASSVTAEIASDDPYVAVSEGVASFGSISPAQTVWGQEAFVLAVSPDCPDGHELAFSVKITDGDGSFWSDVVEVLVEAPDFSLGNLMIADSDQALPNGQLDPGETVRLTVTLNNEGGKAGNNTHATLRATDPDIAVLDSTADFGFIPRGGQADHSNDPFVISADPIMFFGHQAQFSLHLESNSGMMDTEILSLTVGTQTSADPTGPDSYGYFAYDNSDLRYYDSPQYEWVEIDPSYGGSGTLVSLVDEPAPPPGPPWGYIPYYPQGDTEVLPLPFSFVFYGGTYDRIAVCSNGWLSMGSTWMTNFRNWSIPATLSPPCLIAPFWDDLYMGDGHVAYYYDAPGHRFVVEWSRVFNDYDDAPETFQVILYDPSFHQTVSGDGEILFQYHTVKNSDYAFNYATVGIEAPGKKSGVEYTYAGQNAPGAGDLRDGLSIKFTTGKPLPQGPYLNFYGCVADDDSVGVSFGDGDSRVESGETCELQISLQNIGDEEATDIWGVLSTEDVHITLIEDTALFPEAGVHAVCTNAAGPFVFTLSEETPYHHASFDLSLDSNNGRYETVVRFELEVGRENILLVNSDGGGFIKQFYTDPLDVLDPIFRYHDRLRGGPLDPSLVDEYETVIWFTGNQRDSTLTPADQLWLGLFLDNGGSLFLSGQNIASDLRASAFLRDYVRAEFVADSSGNNLMNGAAGDPITGTYGLLSLASGDYGANNQNSPDAVQPLEGACPIFKYFQSDYSAALRYLNDYRVVYFAVGFESIVDFYDVAGGDALRVDMLRRILNWFRFEPQVGDVNEDGAVNILDIVKTVNIILTLESNPTEYHMWASDCNGDGGVDVLDVVGIVNVILGVGSCSN
ncbi:MAG: hypothetical protein JSV84_16920 [Gemmatimonadota bacterium]|nr:MAG: hypothetical protein JSV84_16920 [Gemmatimonadota bacterium]